MFNFCVTTKSPLIIQRAMLFYLHRVKIPWIIMHQIWPPQLDVRHFEHTRWASGGGYTVAVLVHQSDLQAGCGGTFNGYLVFNYT